MRWGLLGAGLAASLGPAIVFVLAAGLWNGEPFIKLKQLWITLFVIAGLESIGVVTAILSTCCKVDFDTYQTYGLVPFTPSAIRHWVLALMVYFTWTGLPSDLDTPEGLFANNQPSVITYDALRHLLRLYLVLALCMGDLMLQFVSTTMILRQPYRRGGTESRKMLN